MAAKKKTAEVTEQINETAIETPVHDVPEMAGKVANCVSLNLREHPNKEAKIITVIPEGEEVQVLDDTVNGWYRAKYKGYLGYIMASYVTMH